MPSRSRQATSIVEKTLGRPISTRSASRWYGLGSDDVSRGGVELLDVQPAARTFAHALQAVLRAQTDDGAEEARLVHAMMVQEGWIGAGNRRHDHLADAELCPCPRSIRRAHRRQCIRHSLLHFCGYDPGRRLECTLGVAIFGAGRAGHGHARAIAETAGAELVAVFDTDRERADAFAEKHGCLAFVER